MKIRITNKAANKTMETELQIDKDRGRVYLGATTHYYDLIPGDVDGVETIRTKINGASVVEVI